jgi:hypothetical protein
MKLKIKAYNLLFRFFSFLSDKTNGAPFFVKYKLLSGTLIIGLIGISCVNKNRQVTCYEPASMPEDDSLQVTCDEYVPMDTLDNAEELDNMVTCYKVILPDEPTGNENMKE